MRIVRKTLTLTTTVFALAGCPNQGIQAINASPEATIVSHSDGDEVLEGTSVAFWGVASDADHPSQDLTASWYLNSLEICPPTAVDADGMTSCEAVIGPSDSSLVLEVRDPKGAAGAATVSLAVMPSDTPTATISSPEATGIYYSDQLMVFEGEVSDAEDDASSLTAWWSSSLDGDLDVQAEPSSAGEVFGSGYLSEGEHAITLHALDSSGKTGTDSVIVAVGPPNGAPTCAITEPADGAAAELGETVVFRGEVEDEDVPADWLTVTWESDKDGSLGTSAPDSAGEVALAWSDLTQGTHTITMRVEDEVGATCSDFILFTAGAAPIVEITLPASGSSFDEDGLVSFEGAVSDSEDSATSLSISWESSLDGVLDETGPDSSGLTMFSSSALQVGEHSITLTATDTDGLYSRDMITLTITECTDQWFVDADGDGFGDPGSVRTACDQPSGYVADATDCDDAAANVNPDADETCNGVDDDCDGAVDEDDATDATTWYADADGDSFGDPASATTACSQPSAYVADDTDCDDADAGISPDADELCDGVDNDCDGAVDEDDATDASTWYADADSDGYGDAGSSTAACTQPSGYVSDDTDCDDDAGAIHPGATEVTADGIDQDCSGGDDCYVDGDGDGYGTTATTMSSDLDCTDGGEAATSDDCLDSGTSASFAFPGAASQESLTACMMDYDGDGWGSMTAPGTGQAGTDCDDTDATSFPGGTEICGDGLDGDCDGVDLACGYTGIYDLASWGIRIDGENTSSSQDRAGWAVSSAGDMNADGYDDLLIGGFTDTEGGGPYAGAAWLVDGPVTRDFRLSSSDAKIVGERAYDYAGYSVASAGDVNADGYDDLMIGAVAADGGTTFAGAAYLVYGPMMSDLDFSAADAKLSSPSGGENVGYSLAGPGDVNADGYDDLLIGAPSIWSGGGAGAAYLVNGPVTGDMSMSSATAMGGSA